MKIKLLTIIGARPQIIKAAAISRAIKTSFSGQIEDIIVHTGQHYDENMSAVFFKELDIPEADHCLNVGSASHGKQTAAMLQGIEEIIIKTRPDYVVLYGDTNSTIAGALAASKIRVPVVHIEAGLRSFNKTMPEEINRIVCDHVSTFLFVPTLTGMENLKNEGFKLDNSKPFHLNNPQIHHCGDVMYDNSLHFSTLATQKSKILAEYNLEKGNFILGTIHRDNNTDNPERLNSIFEAILFIATNSKQKFILPLHPRTSKLLSTNLNSKLYSEVIKNALLKIIPPVSFFDMLVLEKHCSLILTDSGGVQKESFFFQKPCIIMRSESEWVEIVKNGNAIIADADKDRIIEAYRHFTTEKKLTYPEIFGDGRAAHFICSKILESHAYVLRNE